MNRVRLIGPGRAGRSLVAALEAVGGYTVVGVVGRGEPVTGAAEGADIVVVAVPDHAVAPVAAAVAPSPGTAVVHLSGSLGLDVLGPHERRASLHPLVPLPNPTVGSVRLRTGVTFAVAGDPVARAMAGALGGRAVTVEDDRRASYHAAATIAANHLVALLGQVERVAGVAGLPLDAFTGLVLAAVEDALAMGPKGALTGPAARGDWTTIDRHRRMLAELPGARSELAAYDAMVGLARRLVVEPTGDAVPADAGERADEGRLDGVPLAGVPFAGIAAAGSVG